MLWGHPVPPRQGKDWGRGRVRMAGLGAVVTLKTKGLL